MDQNDKPPFLALLMTIAEYFRQPLGNDVSFLYWHTLKSLPWEAVKQAFVTHLQDPNAGRWMPKAADILKQLQGDVGRQAGVAWEKVEGAISRVGRYNDVAFDDPIIHMAIKSMGGWVKLCASLCDKLPIYRKHFEALYEQAAGSNLSDGEYPCYLAGVMSGSGAAPVLVGKQKQAQDVAKGVYKAREQARQKLKLVPNT